MRLEKGILILGILISTFVFAVSFATLYAQIHIEEGNVCSCTLPIPLLIPTFASFGVLIGLISYYLVSPIILRRCSQNLGTFLEILDPREKEIIQLLIENKGEISQAKISKKLGKVRAFRVLEKLKARGIIEKEKKKKTNKIRLVKDFLDLFS
jgi:uncharacterized membrane protein